MAPERQLRPIDDVDDQAPQRSHFETGMMSTGYLKMAEAFAELFENNFGFVARKVAAQDAIPALVGFHQDDTDKYFLLEEKNTVDEITGKKTTARVVSSFDLTSGVFSRVRIAATEGNQHLHASSRTIVIPERERLAEAARWAKTGGFDYTYPPIEEGPRSPRTTRTPYGQPMNQTQLSQFADSLQGSRKKDNYTENARAHARTLKKPT